MRSELKKLQRELGITFIHVTHGQDEALALADEIVVMNNAVIEQAGPAREVWATPRTEFVARFIGGHNVIAFPQGKVTVRADAVRIASDGLAATVVAVEYQGAAVAVTTRTESGDEVLALLPEDQFFAAPKAPGDPVRLSWDEQSLHHLPA
jgi:putative spermidine/putrescine transport system ATP-binding protein